MLQGTPSMTYDIGVSSGTSSSMKALQMAICSMAISLERIGSGESSD